MIRVRLLKTMAGPQGAFQPGDIATFPERLAYDLIEGGHAEEVADQAPRKATLPAPEKAVSPEGGRPSMEAGEGAPAAGGEHADGTEDYDEAVAAYWAAHMGLPWA